MRRLPQSKCLWLTLLCLLAGAATRAANLTPDPLPEVAYVDRDHYKLLATDAAGRPITWAVDPAGSATVSADGTVEFLKPGFVTFTASSTNLTFTQGAQTSSYPGKQTVLVRLLTMEPEYLEQIQTVGNHFRNESGVQTSAVERWEYDEGYCSEEGGYLYFVKPGTFHLKGYDAHDNVLIDRSITAEMWQVGDTYKSLTLVETFEAPTRTNGDAKVYRYSVMPLTGYTASGSKYTFSEPGTYTFTPYDRWDNAGATITVEVKPTANLELVDFDKLPSVCKKALGFNIKNEQGATFACPQAAVADKGDHTVLLFTQAGKATVTRTDANGLTATKGVDVLDFVSETYSVDASQVSNIYEVGEEVRLPRAKQAVDDGETKALAWSWSNGLNSLKSNDGLCCFTKPGRGTLEGRLNDKVLFRETVQVKMYAVNLAAWNKRPQVSDHLYFRDLQKSDRTFTAKLWSGDEENFVTTDAWDSPGFYFSKEGEYRVDLTDDLGNEVASVVFNVQPKASNEEPQPVPPSLDELSEEQQLFAEVPFAPAEGVNYKVTAGKAEIKIFGDGSGKIVFPSAGSVEVTCTPTGGVATRRAFQVVDSRTLDPAWIDDFFTINEQERLVWRDNTGSGPMWTSEPAEGMTIEEAPDELRYYATGTKAGTYTLTCKDTGTGHVLCTKQVTVADPHIEGPAVAVGDHFTLPSALFGHNCGWKGGDGYTFDDDYNITFTEPGTVTVETYNYGISYTFEVSETDDCLASLPESFVVGDCHELALRARSSKGIANISVEPADAAYVGYRMHSTWSDDMVGLQALKPGKMTIKATYADGSTNTKTITAELPAINTAEIKKAYYVGDYIDEPGLDRDVYCRYGIDWVWSNPELIQGSRLVAPGVETATAIDSYGNELASVTFAINEDALPDFDELADEYTVGDIVTLPRATMAGNSYSVSGLYTVGDGQYQFTRIGQQTVTLSVGRQTVYEKTVTVRPLSLDLSYLRADQKVGNKVMLPNYDANGRPLDWMCSPQYASIEPQTNCCQVTFLKAGSVMLAAYDGVTQKTFNVTIDQALPAKTVYAVGETFSIPGVLTKCATIGSIVLQAGSANTFQFVKPGESRLTATDVYGNQILDCTLTGVLPTFDWSKWRGPYHPGDEISLGTRNSVEVQPADAAVYEDGKYRFLRTGDVTFSVYDLSGNCLGSHTFTVETPDANLAELATAVLGVPITLPAAYYKPEPDNAVVQTRYEDHTSLTFTKTGNVTLTANGTSTTVSVELDRIDFSATKTDAAVGVMGRLPAATVGGQSVRYSNNATDQLDKWYDNGGYKFVKPGTVTFSGRDQYGNVIGTIDINADYDGVVEPEFDDVYYPGDVITINLASNRGQQLNYDTDRFSYHNFVRDRDQLSVTFRSPGAVMLKVYSDDRDKPLWQHTFTVLEREPEVLALGDVSGDYYVGATIALPAKSGNAALDWTLSDPSLALLVNAIDHYELHLNAVGKLTLTAANHDYTLNIKADEVDLTDVPTSYVVGGRSIGEALPTKSAAGVGLDWKCADESMMDNHTPRRSGQTTLTAYDVIRGQTLATLNVTFVNDKVDKSGVKPEYTVGEALQLPAKGVAGVPLTWTITPTLLLDNLNQCRLPAAGLYEAVATDQYHYKLAEVTFHVVSNVVALDALPTAALVGETLQLPAKSGSNKLDWKPAPASAVILDDVDPQGEWLLATFAEPTEALALVASKHTGDKAELARQTIQVALPKVTLPDVSNILVGDDLQLPATTDNGLQLTWLTEEGTAFNTNEAGSFVLTATDKFGNTYAPLTVEVKATALDPVLATADPDAPVIYFDLSGRPVKPAHPGIYVRRQGSNAKLVRFK